MTQSVKFQFLPLNYSWVALQPRPKGIIYFIGGAFFGTFPTIFYRFLLNHLFEQGYTIVALPYRFSLRHWPVATQLAADQTTLEQALIDEAKHRQYDYRVYEDKTSGDHIWVGHSLGCKYIALLELLTDLEMHGDEATARLSECIPPVGQAIFREALAQVDLSEVSLRNQSSVLLAPAIEGLEGAVPILRMPAFAWLKTALNKIGIKVEPSQAETFCLAERGKAFNLTSLISFQGDTRVAGPTVTWLRTHLLPRLVQSSELPGRHLAPMGWRRGNLDIARTVTTFIERSTQQVRASSPRSDEAASVSPIAAE